MQHWPFAVHHSTGKAVRVLSNVECLRYTGFVVPWLPLTLADELSGAPTGANNMVDCRESAVACMKTSQLLWTVCFCYNYCHPVLSTDASPWLVYWRELVIAVPA